MPRYRRNRVPGGLYFFTVVTHRRRPILTTDLGRRCLGNALRLIQLARPFEMPGVVLLPDHLHAIWRLPPGDDDYSTRWRLVKKEFTVAWRASGGGESPVCDSKQRRGERGLWQRRFWEHTLRDERDFDRHLDYIHFNPVKHGLARCARDWPWSSFHRWVRAGVLPEDWACGGVPPDFDDLDDTAME